MLAVKACHTAANSSRIRPRCSRSARAYRAAVAAISSSRVVMPIRLITHLASSSPALAAFQVRQRVSV